MNQIDTLRAVSVSIVLFIFIFFTIGGILQTRLPADILAYMHQLPYAYLTKYFLIASVILLVSSLVGIWKQKHFSPWLMIATLTTYMVADGLMIPRVDYTGVIFFCAFPCYLWGMLYAIVCSSPYSQLINSSYNFATIKNFRICSIILLGLMILTIALPNDKPTAFASFAVSSHSGLIDYLEIIEIIAMICVCFHFRIAKYIFIISTALMWNFKAQVISQDYSVDPLANFLQGTMVTMLFFKPLSQQLKAHKKSNEYYQHIAYKKTGWGIRGIVILALLAAIPGAIKMSIANHFMENKNAMIIMKMTKPLYNNNQLITPQNSLYKFYDDNQNLIGVIDLNANDIRQYQNIKTLKILRTHNETVFYDAQHNELYHKVGLLNSNHLTTTYVVFDLIFQQFKSSIVISYIVEQYVSLFFVILGTFIFFTLCAAYGSKKCKLAALGFNFKTRFRLHAAYLMPAFCIFCLIDNMIGWLTIATYIMLSYERLPKLVSKH